VGCDSEFVFHPAAFVPDVAETVMEVPEPDRFKLLLLFQVNPFGALDTEKVYDEPEQIAVEPLRAKRQLALLTEFLITLPGCEPNPKLKLTVEQ
jgi:hypothetical protein